MLAKPMPSQPVQPVPAHPKLMRNDHSNSVQTTNSSEEPKPTPIASRSKRPRRRKQYPNNTRARALLASRRIDGDFTSMTTDQKKLVILENLQNFLRAKLSLLDKKRARPDLIDKKPINDQLYETVLSCMVMLSSGSNKLFYDIKVTATLISYAIKMLEREKESLLKNFPVLLLLFIEKDIINNNFRKVFYSFLANLFLSYQLVKSTDGGEENGVFVIDENVQELMKQAAKMGVDPGNPQPFTWQPINNKSIAYSVEAAYVRGKSSFQPFSEFIQAELLPLYERYKRENIGDEKTPLPVRQIDYMPVTPPSNHSVVDDALTSRIISAISSRAVYSLNTRVAVLEPLARTGSSGLEKVEAFLNHLYSKLKQSLTQKIEDNISEYVECLKTPAAWGLSYDATVLIFMVFVIKMIKEEKEEVLAAVFERFLTLLVEKNAISEHVRENFYIYVSYFCSGCRVRFDNLSRFDGKLIDSKTKIFFEQAARIGMGLDSFIKQLSKEKQLYFYGSFNTEQFLGQSIEKVKKLVQPFIHSVPAGLLLFFKEYQDKVCSELLKVIPIKPLVDMMGDYCFFRHPSELVTESHLAYWQQESSLSLKR